MDAGERIRKFGVFAFSEIKIFAEAMDMKPPNLQKYMRGEREPGLGILQKLQGLGCSIDWVISGEGNMFAKNEAGNALKDKAELINV